MAPSGTRSPCASSLLESPGVSKATECKVRGEWEQTSPRELQLMLRLPKKTQALRDLPTDGVLS